MKPEGKHIGKVGHGTIGLIENSSFARFASRRTSDRDMAACRL